MPSGWRPRKPTTFARRQCCASADWRSPGLRHPKELDGLSGPLRIAFVSGHSRWWRKQRLVAKYFKMRLEGLVYPDVYCLALMLSDKFDFLLEDEKVPPGRYDVIFAELQSSETQLRYLESLVEAHDPPVTVIPGPPAILSRDLTDTKLHRVQAHPGGARDVWAYSPGAQNVLRWPDRPRARDHHSLAIRFGGHAEVGTNFARAIPRGSKILVQAPMSFHDIVQNHPFVLKGVLLDVWQELPDALREELTFHTFVYNSTDLRAIQVVRLCRRAALRAGRQTRLSFLCSFPRRVRRRHQSDRGQHSRTGHVSRGGAWTSRNFQRQQPAQCSPVSRLDGRHV